ncbi:bifunctional heptose 7-phosphate kinase/heptose 1-phosphate adenyltransferase [Pseudonocardia oceani]|uniref:Bifunctional hydroxymethylpyrimidine kinase/phosphomethylpyrimidine kinase n=4 Tax=Pseudonocardia oceani TaxID=2792013 RepID=A0ABS6UJ00_9PSEU|nr:PfkB family carbohydrate kinase [Pseudonocardia oceani]MBW0131819.1 bifunctional hydroxymethylpyrimidine kinase/phosphomethylpyrimidine kinase [Pseudonocardia oceani]
MTGVVVVGDLLLDEDVDGRAERLCPDAPAPVLDVDAERDRPGGAGLAAVLLAASVPVRLVAALDEDDAARRLRGLLAGCVELVAGPGTGGTAVKTRLRADGRVLLRADRGAGRAAPGFGRALGPALRGALRPSPSGGSVLVSDYGRGVAADPRVRAALRATRRPVVWDPHPRGGDPVPGTSVVTPNLSEACAVLGVPAPAPDDDEAVLRLADALRERWRVGAVVVTLGSRGAALQGGSGGAVVPAPPAVDGDPCGAGDRFAGELAAALGTGASLRRAVERGVTAASAFVAAGGAGAVRRTARGWGQPDSAPSRSVRSAGA